MQGGAVQQNGSCQDDTVRKVQFNYDITPQETEKNYVVLTTREQVLLLIQTVEKVC
jgi:hypothetical protein